MIDVSCDFDEVNIDNIVNRKCLDYFYFLFFFVELYVFVVVCFEFFFFLTSFLSSVDNTLKERYTRSKIASHVSGIFHM